MSENQRPEPDLLSDSEADPRGAILLEIARTSLREALTGSARRDAGGDVPPWLLENAATFVTLRKLGDLRGCVGSVKAVRPLIVDVRENAVAAAMRDPRFPPLDPEELEEVDLEVTLLSPLQPLTFSTESEALAQLEPGIDGVLLQWHGYRATYLPQVWEALSEPGTFLASLKQKAGLAADFWHPEVEILRYSARHWSESKG